MLTCDIQIALADKLTLTTREPFKNLSKEGELVKLLEGCHYCTARARLVGLVLSQARTLVPRQCHPPRPYPFFFAYKREKTSN